MTSSKSDDLKWVSQSKAVCFCQSTLCFAKKEKRSTVEVPRGTSVLVRLSQSHSSKSHSPGKAHKKSGKSEPRGTYCETHFWWMIQMSFESFYLSHKRLKSDSWFESESWFVHVLPESGDRHRRRHLKVVFVVVVIVGGGEVVLARKLVTGRLWPRESEKLSNTYSSIHVVWEMSYFK